MNISWTVFSKSPESLVPDLQVHADVILPVFSRRQTPDAPFASPRHPFLADSPHPHDNALLIQSSTIFSDNKAEPAILTQSVECRDGARPRSFLTDFIENSLLYQIFRADFGAILEYCLHPDLHPPSFYEASVRPHSAILIQMIRKCRVNKLKTEQKIKKVINHAYDMMKRRYLNERYKNLGHISDNHKREVFVHYFNKDGLTGEEFTRRMTEEPLWRSADKFNLAYNKRFFGYVRACPQFITDLTVAIDKLEALSVETIKNDLRLFIKDVVRFAYQNCSQPITAYLPPETYIVEFFDAKVQKELNKKGIKFPWTEAQYKNSIKILRSYISEPSGIGSPGDGPREPDSQASEENP
jgi:hypothetical protein